MAKITAKRPALKKGASTQSTLTAAQLAELQANQEHVDGLFEEMGKRLDVVEEQIGIEPDGNPAAEEGNGDEKKRCGGKQTAITNYAEGLLWGIVIGSLITSILFIRQAERRRHYLGD